MEVYESMWSRFEAWWSRFEAKDLNYMEGIITKVDGVSVHCTLSTRRSATKLLRFGIESDWNGFLLYEEHLVPRQISKIWRSPSDDFVMIGLGTDSSYVRVLRWRTTCC